MSQRPTPAELADLRDDHSCAVAQLFVEIDALTVENDRLRTDALLAENAKLRGAREWQSGETAPKDGTRFLAWDGRHMVVSSWDCDYGYWSDDYDRLVDVTRWMKLPESPR